MSGNSQRLEHEDRYKLQLAGVLLTMMQIEKIASGEVEPMDDDLADAQLKRIQRLCKAWLDRWVAEGNSAFSTPASATDDKGAWVATTDRLPDIEGEVLVTTKYGVVSTLCWHHIHHCWSNNWDVYEIVAWQPLPAAYAKEAT